MTRTDATLVRDLVDLTDRALPAMSLTPATVLDAGRRHRRQRAARGASIGVLAVAAVVVAAAQLGTHPGPVTAPAAQTVVLVDGLTATVPTSPTAVQTHLGPGVDLGLPADDEHSYVVVANGSQLELRRADADGNIGGESWDLGSIAYPSFWMLTEGDSATVYGQGGPGLEATLVSAPADGSAPLTIPVPTAEVEGFVGAVYLLRIDGAPVDGRWPALSIEVRAGDGTTRSEQIALPAVPLNGITASVADGVQPVETDGGPGWDLGIPPADGWDPRGEGLTYALRVGALLDGDASTPDEPGLWLVTLASDGSTVTGAGGSPDEALAPTSRSPFLFRGFANHEYYVVGVRPPALASATFEVVVSTADGEQRTAIPTFRISDFDADVWFVDLTDDEATTPDWSTVKIVATTADGSTTMWNLYGEEVKAALPETPQG